MSRNEEIETEGRREEGRKRRKAGSDEKREQP